MINIRMQEEVNRLKPKITVIGVGGGGGNAINNMISSGLEGCEFLVCNTDAQALENNLASHKIQLGAHVTRGLGAGANPDIGRAATEESLDEILDYLDGTNMVFITAGMGGGTGTGSAPVIAQAAREQGILTVGVVTKPFHFEGTTRMKLAEGGIGELQKYVDTLIVIPNQNLFRIANEKTTFAEAFRLADEVLQSGVRGVTDLMVMPGLINLDFADIRAVMAEMGKAMMGTGEAEGERRAIEAAEAAIANPLLDDVSMKGARGVLINITGGSDMTLFEVDEAANRIRDEVDPNANIIFGSTFLDELEGRMRVSIVATGIDLEASRRPVPTTANLSVVGQQQTPAPQQQPQQQAATARQTPTTLRDGGPQRLGLGSRRPESFAGATPAIRPEIAARAMTLPHQTSPLGRPTASGEEAGTLSQGGADVTAGGHQQAASTAPQQPQTGSYSYNPMPAQAAAATARKADTGYRAPTIPPALPPIAPTKAALRQEQERQKRMGEHPPRPYQTSPTGAGPATPPPQGQRMADTFIPPKPVVPTRGGNGDLFGTAEAPPVAQQPESQQPAAAPRRAETPTPKPSQSLFERFTGKGGEGQGNLRVEQGGKTGGDDDDLDIPAFLRRQAN